MTNTLEITIHNSETGEIITRPLNNEELAQLETDKANATAAQLAQEARATAKAALLSKLGISADEAKLLLG